MFAIIRPSETDGFRVYLILELTYVLWELLPLSGFCSQNQSLYSVSEGVYTCIEQLTSFCTVASMNGPLRSTQLIKLLLFSDGIGSGVSPTPVLQIN